MTEDMVRGPAFRQIFLYNLASFTFNLYDTIIYAWLPYFYTPPAGSGRTAFITLTTLGVLMAGGRILDAVTDPLVGYFSDHTHSRWGRRKPYVFVANPILFVAFVMVFTPPVAGVSLTNALYLGAALFLFYCGYTGVLIPWFAYLPEMSSDNRTRVKVAAVGVGVGLVGALIGGGLSGPLFERVGPLPMALSLGVLGLVAGELTLFGIHEPPRPATREKMPPFGKVVREVFLDRQVLSFCVMIMLVQLTYQLMLMNIPYLTTLILKERESTSSVLMGEVVILSGLATPFWYWLLHRFPKRRVFRFIICWMVAGFTLSFFIGHLPLGSPFVQAVIVFTVAAAPIGGMFTAVLGILSDLTDYDEIKSGQRREAIYFGIYGIVRKTGWALCSLILATVYSIFGYSTDNYMGVRVVYLVCAGSCLAGLVVFIPYRLGDSQEETRAIMFGGARDKENS